ncbi:nuclear factor NF-kappa-B p110 subunit-like [Teleopsis dalmanni]|uniref:nuclear factor NF-kappa-B p110 subunit-like n=1 Tax=Teleopsis dalmanni TaxID=139649 RepID=UPI0018CE4FAC|nr:nuclear factor NF-kappa-B p110 subunit-like [Teleopsis dalmanni]
MFALNNMETSPSVSFRITEQPKQHHRFRYESEKNSTHGILTSEHSASKAVPCFPTVELIAPHCINNEFFIKCDLYEPMFKNNSEMKYMLSPNKLKIKKSKKDSDSNSESDCPFIFDKMIVCEDNPTKHIFSLNNCYITKTKNKDKETILQEKSNKMDEKKLQIDEINNLQSISNNSNQTKIVSNDFVEKVCLGFTVYQMISMKYKRVCETLFSNPIINGMKNKINKICTTYGNVDGNDEVTLLVHDTNACIIRVYELDANGEVVWERIIEPTELLQKNKAIVFKTPKYGGQWTNKSVQQKECLVEVICNEDNTTTEPVIFIYQNLCVESTASARKRPRIETFVYENSNTTANNVIEMPTEPLYRDSVQIHKKQRNRDKAFLSSCNSSFPQITNAETPKRSHQYIKLDYVTFSDDSDIKNYLHNSLTKLLKNTPDLILNIEQFNSVYTDKHEFGNTIFHDAIEYDEFLILYNNKQIEDITPLISAAVNKLQMSLLHYTCLLNKADYIRSLIRLTCSICVLDVNQNTPLHIAINKQHENCIVKFRELLQRPEDYNNLTEDFLRLLTIYDRYGHTVLHSAVLKNMQELVVDILNFCKRSNLKVENMKTLGNGNTILHLAFNENLEDMFDLIHNQYPNMIDCENYAGVTTNDLMLLAEQSVNGVIQDVQQIQLNTCE